MAAAVAHSNADPKPDIRLQRLIGSRVTLVTLRDRYTGTLRAVHPNAAWLELRDDCLVAITDAVISVAPVRH